MEGAEEVGDRDLQDLAGTYWFAVFLARGVYFPFSSDSYPFC